MTIADVASMLVFALAAVMLLGLVRDRLSRSETSLAGLSLGAHLVSALAQVWITTIYYEGGDMLKYHEQGNMLADAMRVDLPTFLPATVRMIFQQESRLPFEIPSDGTATGTMVGIAALYLLFTGGSLYGACAGFGVFAFFGKLAMYFALRRHFPLQHRTYVMVAAMLVPSAVFWSAGIIKEAVALTAIGVMVFGADRVAQGSLLKGAAILGAGGVMVAVVKPYILFPFVLAFGAWMYWARAQRRGAVVVIKPIYFLVAGGVAIGGVVLLGVLFPRYAVENLGKSAAYAQDVGSQVGGGSYYEMGDPTEQSLGGQLAYAPLALLTALFRPLFFEVRNVLMLVTVIETMTLTLLLLRSLFARSLAGAWRRIMDTPVLVFSLVFVLTFAVAVGLVTTNLGTLSRYRMPLMPFFALLIAGLARQPAPTVEGSPRLKPAQSGAAR